MADVLVGKIMAHVKPALRIDSARAPAAISVSNKAA